MENIIVLGSINMDLVTVVDRKPLDGETIMGKDFFTAHGGKGANQGVSIGKLGGKVKFLGKVGNDAFGVEILENMKNQGIDIKNIEIVEGSTGLATIILDKNGENSIIVVSGANGKVDKEYIEKNKDSFIEGSILLSQLELPYETVKYSFELAKEKGTKTILNPAPATDNIDELLELSDIVICNETEFDLIIGEKTENPQEIIDKSPKLLTKGVKELLVTLGSKGVIYINENEVRRYNAYKVTAIDTTAAGDSFIGGFVAFLHEGIDKAIDMGMKAGAIAVTRFGAQKSLANLEEVENFGK